MPLYVSRANIIEVGIFSGPPPTRTIWPASMATSVPVPIAIPRSAPVRAGASLIPSPAKATRLPLACHFLTIAS